LNVSNSLAAVGCPDLTGNNIVDTDDLLVVINNWGNPGAGDLNKSGIVDTDDLLLVINGWGQCIVDTPPTSSDLAGKALGKFPFFDYSIAFNAGSTVQLALDPFLHPDVAGLTADVYVVDDRSAAEWTLDATLVDVRAGGPQSISFLGPNVQGNVFTLDAGTLSAAAGTGLGVGYDVVIDANSNGALDSGDVIDGADGAGFYVVHDLTVAGPLAVTQINYTGGTFLGQRTFYPTDIANMGQLPLVVISHGNGHQHTWYDYLQSHLASYGYIVMSHQNNTVPGIESASTTTLTNTNYILANQATIAGGVLNGHIDGHTIIWIGHSRGGEGVVRAYDRIFDNTYNPATYDLEDIVLISSIAPTDFLGTNSANPHSVAYHLIYGSSDGDVCGCPDNDIADSFNVFERALGPRASTYVHGADHNDFNCCGINDFAGPVGTAIGSAEAQRVAKSAYLALIKFTLEGNLAAKDYLWRQWESLKPIGVSVNTIVVNDFRNLYNAPTDFVIEDYQKFPATSISSSEGGVTFDVLNMVEAKCNDNNTSFTWFTTDPMNGNVRGRTTDIAQCSVFDYNSAATPLSIELQIVPLMTDWSGMKYFSLRAAKGTRHPDTNAFTGDLNFSVVLRDANNVSSAINIGAYFGGIEHPYLRTGFGTGAGWQNEFEVIRIRLADFLANGNQLDFSNMAAIRLEFGGPDNTTRGRIHLDDIMVTPN
jgi:predicted dienelactone hydrolase